MTFKEVLKLLMPYRGCLAFVMNAFQRDNIRIYNRICLLTIMFCVFLVSCFSENAVTEDTVHFGDVVVVLGDIMLQPSELTSQNSDKAKRCEDLINDAAIIEAQNRAMLSEDDVYGHEIANWYDAQDYQFPLIAAIQEENIYLYATRGCIQETVLFVGDVSHTYKIPWNTPRWFMPDMKLYDFDNDGRDELAITHYYGSGTSVSIWGLTVIEINESTEDGESWALYSFAPEDYLKQVNDVIAYSTTDINNSIFVITIAGETSDFNFADSLWDDDFIKEIGCRGDTVQFSFCEDGIEAKIGISAYHNNWATPDNFGSVFADVLYSEGEFKLSDFSYMSFREQDIE